MSRTLNKAMLIGNVVAKPELNVTPKGIPVMTFYVMTDRQWRKGDEMRTSSTAHACVAWSKLAEICDQLLDVGDLVYVEGRMENKKLVDDQGIEKEITELVINEMKLLSKGNKEQSYEYEN